MSNKKKRRDDNRSGPIWWCETDGELIARVVEMHETNDSDDYERDSNWIDWDAIAPEGLSGADAKERWDSLSRDVPRRRTNAEIARIVQKNFNGAKLTGNVLNSDQFQKVAGMRRHPMKLKAQDLYPDIPKRPMSAFFLWAEEHRESVREQLPNAQAKDIQRILGERWRETPDSVKEEFKKKAQDAMERYYAEMEEFYDLHPEAKTDKKLSRVPLKKPKIGDDAPKPPPRSGYLLFLQEVRPSMPADMPFTEAVKLIATQWHELSEEVRKSYTTRLEELWQKYEEDWKNFMQTIPSHQKAELDKLRKHHLQNSQSPFAKQQLREPVKPTAYKMFVAANKDQLENQLPEHDRGRINSKLREMWKILDPKAKEPFELEAKRAEHKYHQDWLEYERVLKEQDAYKLDTEPPPPAHHPQHQPQHHHTHTHPHAHQAHHPHTQHQQHPQHPQQLQHHQMAPPPHHPFLHPVSHAPPPPQPTAPPHALPTHTTHQQSPHHHAPPPPHMTQLPIQKRQWMYKEGNKYVYFPEKDTAVLDRAFDQWKKNGSNAEDIMELNIMSDDCTVDFKNMWFTAPGGDPIRLRQKLVR